jgi:hypothetical protein
MNVRCLVIGGGPELDTARFTIAQRPPPVWVKRRHRRTSRNLLAARDLVHLLYAYRCRRVFMAMVNMEFDHAHYI